MSKLSWPNQAQGLIGELQEPGEFPVIIKRGFVLKLTLLEYVDSH